jgi:serine/threonine-protein kinase
MSPEQAIGENIDGRSDQYSLACVLYELLAGQPPFTGPTPMAVLARHSLERVPSLQIVRHSIPEGVEVVILRALEKVPADRYPTIGDFAEALRTAEIERISTRTGARPVPTRELPRSPLAESRARRKRLIVIAGVVSAVLLATGGVYLWRRSTSRAPSAVAEGSDPRKVAVLYFASRGGSDSLSYLADGLTEALITELAGVKALQVISRNGVTPYRNAAIPPDSISRALGVGTLVSGTVTQSGDRLRVNVALVNAVTGAEIGNKTIERPRAELFALQDDLAKEVSFFLREQLGEEIALRERRAGSRNVQAWELVQQAQHAVDDGERLAAAGDSAGSTARLVQADSLLSQAERLDPKWVAPIVSRGWTAYQQTRLRGNFNKEYYEKWYQTGLRQAEVALKLEPTNADALELRGTLQYWRWLLNLSPNQREAAALFAGAERDFRASITANPNQATAWTSLTHLLLAKSATAEAKLAALKAYEADPYLKTANLTVWRLFQSSLDLEDGVEAKHWCTEGQRRFTDDPRFVECRLWLFILKDQKADVAEAWKLLAEYTRLSPPGERAYRRLHGQMIVAMALARAGLTDSARSVAQRSRGDATTDPTRDLAYLEAIARNLMGDRDEALRLLGTYLATNPQLRESVAKDESWYFRNLREDPKYRSLLGLPGA